jgi:poly(3-hydroxybutyrate) depolymerase
LIKGDNSYADNHRTFYDEYNAVLDMDADYYLETIKVVFQDMRLVKGTWDVKSLDGKMERVRPQDIKGTALLTIEGELDDISGSGQTQAAQGLCTGIKPSQLKHLEVPGAGHYGIFSGRRWREVVYPNVREFILSHQPSLSDSLKADKLKAASIKKDPKKAAPRSKPIAASSAASKRNNKRASSI